VFIGTNIHAPPHVRQYHPSCTVPSFDARRIATAAVACLRRIFRPQHAYKRAGVLLSELTRRCGIQPLLFEPRDDDRLYRLMQTMDRINDCSGRWAPGGRNVTGP